MEDAANAQDLPITTAFYGDDMSYRDAWVGARVCTYNAGKSLLREAGPQGITQASHLSRLLTMRSVDITVIQEPGIGD